jgi:hypothetical protein
LIRRIDVRLRAGERSHARHGGPLGYPQVWTHRWRAATRKSISMIPPPGQMWRRGDHLLIEGSILQRLPPKFGKAHLHTFFFKNFLHLENLLWKSSVNC